jgi:hypothetical protein
MGFIGLLLSIVVVFFKLTIMRRGSSRGSRAVALELERRRAQQDAPVPGLEQYAADQGWHSEIDPVLVGGNDLIAYLIVVQRDPDKLLEAGWSGVSAASWDVRYTHAYRGVRGECACSVANAFVSSSSDTTARLVRGLGTCYPAGVVLMRVNRILFPMKVQPRTRQTMGLAYVKADRIGHADFDHRFHIEASTLPGIGEYPETMITAILCRDDWAIAVNADAVVVARVEPFSSADDLQSFLAIVEGLVATLPDYVDFMPKHLARNLPTIEQLRRAMPDPFGEKGADRHF